MSRVKHFDLLNDPLDGTNLTEASAGTGKTYTIAGLFLRLLLEKGLSVDEILVVTFTEAATEELKDRIRRQVRAAVEAFAAGSSDDALLDQMVRRHDNPETGLRLLKEAIRAFDQAAIFTIHGFCMRMLHDNAFESGSLFDTRLVTDQQTIEREIVEDFWRKHMYGESALFVHYALNKKVGPEGLLALIRNRVGQPYMKIIPTVRPPDKSSPERAFQEAFNHVREAWEKSKVEVEDILTGSESLSRVKYKKEKIPVWVQSMDDYLGSEGHDPVLFKGFEKFTSTEIAGAVKKNAVAPSHSFFDSCEMLKQRQEALEEVFDKSLLALKVTLLHEAGKELDRRKAAQNIQSFDDLLLRLDRALRDKGGEKLGSAIRAKFKAALIDEFQDTDPVQYSIFKSVFSHEGSILHLIGDPKQAIYGFRGADVFAYMDASKKVESRYTLRENWRSEPDLISAVNTLFANAGQPFLYDEIPFHPAAPAKRGDEDSMTVRGGHEPPLQLWFVNAEEAAGTGKTISKAKARDMLARAVTAEISRLLDLGRKNKALVGKAPVREGDIAVLVRTNVEARLMQEALAGFNIPSVLYSTANLFDSHEALEVERVLGGIAEPGRESLVRALLATDMMGIKGEDLHRLMNEETGWEAWLTKLGAYHDLWSKKGFVRMFRSLLFREEVLQRLMSFPDGERRATNLLHLSEVLHEASVKEKLGMAGLLKWLSEQRDPDTPRLEEHQIRLESDENAVKVVTIHKSKGLEYPVVFCPFSWGGSRLRKETGPFTFHDESDNRRLTLDLGSDAREGHRVFAEKEQLAENLRLLYVALTRARNRCYFMWGRFNDAESSAPAYLFHCPEAYGEADIVSGVEARFVDLDDAAVLADLREMEARAGGAIHVSEMPNGPARIWSPYPGREIELNLRTFSGTIDNSWRISSFSSLTSSLHHASEIADRDTLGLAEQPDEPFAEEGGIREESVDIFAFPRGAKASTFFHDVFEHVDFSREDASFTETLIAEKLAGYGFEAKWHETVCDTIKRVISVPLDPARKDFTLSRIAGPDRLNELEFYFPLKMISPGKLKSLFAECKGTPVPGAWAGHMDRLIFSPVAGFMKGFIDMVFRFEDRFYLVDWKSNFLGGSVDDYNQEALAGAMERDYYFLQYHLYAVALNQYLMLRIPDYTYKEHFGGVYYIFLRGVDPEKGPDFGVYRDKPANEFIERLSEKLIMRATCR